MTQVGIVGGGIGGLCLAHGLREAGIPVRVFERTHVRTDWLQGYRIHIDPHGSTALHNCLSPGAWKAFCAAVSDDAGGFAFRTEQLAPLLEIDLPDGHEIDPARRHHGISRIALREALLTDLDGVVEFGRTVEGYDTAEGRVTVRFDDGTTTPVDVLVGADGANSRIRAQLLPTARRLDTGVVAIAGKHRLDGDHGLALPAELLLGVVTVLPADRGFLFTAVWRGDPETSTDYIFWAYADAASAFPDLSEGLPGPDLMTLVSDRIDGWSPGLRSLVAGSEPDTVHALRVRSAEPVKAWTTRPVTLLGDAIHNMTPMAGVGANTALRDAELLTRNLTAVARQESALLPALADYERQMLDYGFRAVATSLRNARLAGNSNRLLRGSMRGTFRLINHLPARIKNRML
jgi:2-polyprenyl-6-methoxyphenol hydroxylase-like FAD-dependent oxidoreductase